MNEEMSTLARNKAGNYFKDGYNCAEAIFLAYRDLLFPETDPAIVKMLTGFGSGLGQAGCLCGALTGSVCILNMLTGRTSNQESRDDAYQYAKEFSDRFTEKFGATCCRVLNPYPFETKEHLTNCLKITGNTGKLLMEFIEENNLADKA